MTTSASGAAGVDLGEATVCPQSLGLRLPRLRPSHVAEISLSMISVSLHKIYCHSLSHPAPSITQKRLGYTLVNASFRSHDDRPLERVVAEPLIFEDRAGHGRNRSEGL